jgi:hypothetical protein
MRASTGSNFNLSQNTNDSGVMVKKEVFKDIERDLL